MPVFNMTKAEGRVGDSSMSDLLALIVVQDNEQLNFIANVKVTITGK